MIHDGIYLIPTLVFGSVLLLGWYILSTIRERSKLAKLGAKPRQLPYYLPFGIDTLWIALEVLHLLDRRLMAWPTKGTPISSYSRNT